VLRDRLWQAHAAVATRGNAGNSSMHPVAVLETQKKGREIRCTHWFLRLNSPQQPAKEGGEFIVKLLKTIMIVAVAAGVLSLGACAQKKEMTPAPVPAPTGSK